MISQNLQPQSNNVYEERNAFWTDLALNQFGNALNFFSIISLGFLAFVVENNELGNLFRMSGKQVIDYKKLFIALSLLTCFFSVVCSAIATLSHLYDLRLTRHTMWTRYRFYEKTGQHLPDDHLALTNNLIPLLKNFYSTVIVPKKFYITDIEMQDKEILDTKFQPLRKRNLQLGRLSYRIFGLQIIFLILSVILFFISIVF